VPNSGHPACIGDTALIRDSACIKTSDLDTLVCTRDPASIWDLGCVRSCIFSLSLFVSEFILA